MTPPAEGGGAGGHSYGPDNSAAVPNRPHPRTPEPSTPTTAMGTRTTIDRGLPPASRGNNDYVFLSGQGMPGGRIPYAAVRSCVEPKSCFVQLETQKGTRSAARFLWAVFTIAHLVPRWAS